jgi:hypothetical protein
MLHDVPDIFPAQAFQSLSRLCGYRLRRSTLLFVLILAVGEIRHPPVAISVSTR